MNKKYIPYIIFGSAFIVLAGLGIYVYRQVKLAMNYCYKMSGFRIRSLKTTNIAFDLGVRFKNNSNIDVLVNGYDLDVYINDKKVSHVKAAHKTLIKGKAISILWVNVSFDPKKIFNDLGYIASLISYFLTAKEKIIIKIEGNVSLQQSFIKLDKFKIPTIEMNVKDIMADDPESKENEICEI